ncbi:asparagine synthase (glutamine-hydrolyzing) [Blastopirellula retiformator]|uniref:asparagine synthase (glutamine-hydrolyzing) n=1 Tax=Blastopirellula retiformator TaxID=2527970 RepID=A0A5C5VLT4_9BACT|nr:asparagine synthase (glutamine-hydrolyzing) [Blastopirellula retiformator]TWT38920.1 Asparagine synthetase [glutamine-hydrolyzing] 1 [Blastopirellula retiformator]
MCGICAVFSKDADASNELVSKGISAIRHRGTDGIGIWSSDDQAIAMGHVRLSLMDLANGAQPLFNETGEIASVVSGEFYDSALLRDRLIATGHHLRTSSDSEILIHLYEDLGTNCLEHLDGEFAFVLWDSKRKRIFAARDRFGVKPLYYAESNNRLYLASEAKALFAMGIKPAWDEQSVFQHLLACMDNDRSLFHSVRQVRPGSYLTDSGAGIDRKSYWELSFDAAETESDRSEAELLNEVRTELRSSVSSRMVADVPVGFMLSGGLDSSIVTSLGMQSRPIGSSAFTVRFEHAAYDESLRARAVADHCGTPLVEIRVGLREIADHFAKAVWHGETVCFNGHAQARFLLSQQISRHGFKAVVGGEGADELFAGYHFFDSPNPERGVDKTKVNELASVIDQLGCLPSMIQGFWQARKPIRELLSQDWKARSRNPFESMLENLDIKEISKYQPLTQSQSIWIQTFLPNYVLAAERLDMAHSVEVRQPFLSHKLFDVVKHVPANLLRNRFADKPLLRKASSDWLPHEILKCPKHPFTAPPATLNDNPLMEFFFDVFHSRDFQDLPFFDCEKVIRLVDGLESMTPSQRIAMDQPLSIIASLCVLQREFISGSKPIALH